MQRIETELLHLIDPLTNFMVTAKVPDLLVHWKPSTHFVDRLVHPKAELIQKNPEFFRDSEHMEHGFFAAAGPAIQNRGQIADVEVLDLAPTFLALLNELKPEQMTGNVIKELLSN